VYLIFISIYFCIAYTKIIIVRKLMIAKSS